MSELVDKDSLKFETNAVKLAIIGVYLEQDNGPSLIANNILYFALKNPEMRKQVAKKCAEQGIQGAEAVILNFQNFDIKDPKAEAEVVTICVEQGPDVAEKIAENIKDLQIKDPTFRKWMSKFEVL